MMLCLSNSLILAAIAAALTQTTWAQEQIADEADSALPVAPAIRGTESDPTRSYDPYPSPDAGYVTDLADLLSKSEEQTIERRLWEVEAKTGVEIVVVTIESIWDYRDTGHPTIEAFARGLFNTYGVGNLPKNDGVLLVVAAGDRKARIELGKYFGRSSDAESRRIMDHDIVPYFRREEYAEGITSGVSALMLEFAGVRAGFNWPLISLLVAIPIVAAIALSLFKSGKRGWGWVCVGLLIVLILGVMRLLITAGRYLPESSSDSWGAGGFGGGFGGGSSGGGGASGSW